MLKAFCLQDLYAEDIWRCLLCCMALQLLRICVQIPVPLLRPPQANDVKPLPAFLLNGMEVLTFVCRLLGKDTSGPD